MEISIKSDLKKLERELSRIQRKQIPFAASQAINDVAFLARKQLQKQAQLKLDRPTPPTLRGFLVTKATKNKLTGIVYITPHVDKYLKWQIEGGVQRRSVGKGTNNIAVPVNAPLNNYGNIKGRKKGIIKKAKQFIGTYKGVKGIWETSKKGGDGTIRLIAAFHDTVTHKKTFPFYKVVDGVVNNNFKKLIDNRLRAAIDNAI